MKKVVQFATVHYPFDVRVFHRECRTLVAAGYDVTYVVPHDKDEIVSGVRILAVPKPRSRRERVLKTMWRVFCRSLKADGQVYHFHDPELIPMALLFKLLGKKVIYDAHEDTPRAVLNKTYLPKVLRYPLFRITEAAEKLGMVMFDGLIPATPAIARKFPKTKKTALVQNFPIQEECVRIYPQPFSERPRQIIYAGIIDQVRGIREMVEAMGLIPNELKVTLVLAGKFASKALEEEVRRLPGWKNVNFLGWQRREVVLEQLGLSLAGIVLFHPVPGYPESQPAKLFEYMSAGLPVIASNFEHWRQFVTEPRCGFLVDPRDPKAIAEAIMKVVSDPQAAEEAGRRGRQAIQQRFNWELESRPFLKLYTRLLGRPDDGRSAHSDRC